VCKLGCGAELFGFELEFFGFECAKARVLGCEGIHEGEGPEATHKQTKPDAHGNYARIGMDGNRGQAEAGDVPNNGGDRDGADGTENGSDKEAGEEREPGAKPPPRDPAVAEGESEREDRDRHDDEDARNFRVRGAVEDGGDELKHHEAKNDERPDDPAFPAEESGVELRGARLVRFAHGHENNPLSSPERTIFLYSARRHNGTHLHAPLFSHH
jgi:hypothetical protein